MSWIERENRHRPWIFFLYFLFVLTCLFAGFVFTDSHLMCGPFSELILKWGPAIFFCLYIFLAGVQLPVFTYSHPSKQSRPLTSDRCRGDEFTFHFPVVWSDHFLCKSIKNNWISFQLLTNICLLDICRSENEIWPPTFYYSTTWLQSEKFLLK